MSSERGQRRVRSAASSRRASRAADAAGVGNPVDRLIASRGRVLLAPMAGVTEAPFRALCCRMGASLTYTEMVSTRALHFRPQTLASHGLLKLAPEETPCAVQVFGSEPGMVAEQTARILAAHPGEVALVDVNMGCPVSKVVRRGEGSALMRDLSRAASIVRAAVAASSVPVTVKFRKGWDAGSENAVEFAQAMEAAGAVALAVHGRTRAQFYHGAADWDVIARVKQAVAIPVIGSGDVFSADDVVAMIERTGVDAVMVARGAQGNPWVFREARALLERGERIAPPTLSERIAMAREHARALVSFAGERAVVRMRRHVAWYLNGMPGASYVRGRINACVSHRQLDDLLGEYELYLQRS